MSMTMVPGHALGAGAPHLTLEGVWKSYNSKSEPVVRDVSFRLARGEFMTLLGPSGSGKTTTLMMVAGFELPDQGHIYVQGRDVSYLPPDRRNFGVVFQGYALFPQMTVLENVAFALRMRRVDAPSRRKKSLEMLDKVGLSAFANRFPRELSGGQQQRVALARALVFKPDVLLLDEPLAALDKNMREVLQKEIKNIHRNSGVSVLFITHDQEEAMILSDSVAVMDSGKIVQIDSPEQIYKHPKSTFIASFLGETNLLPCYISHKGDGVVVFTIAGRQFFKARSLNVALGQNSRGMLSLRPESILFLGPHDTADNVASAEVVERTFLGRQVRYTLKALGQSISAIDHSSGDRGALNAPGDHIRIGWSRDAGQILPL